MSVLAALVMTETINNYTVYLSKDYLLSTSADTNTKPTTIVPSDHADFDKENESHTFIIVPLCAICVVILLTGMVRCVLY